MGLKKRLKETLRRRKPIEVGTVDVWGTGRTRDQLTRKPTHGVPTRYTGTIARPGDQSGTVSHADRAGSGKLRGTMVHRFPKTLRGKSVVGDKPDKRE